jgi:hypothetical protein
VDYAKEGTPIGIHQGGALRAAQGDMMDRPATPAKVVSRFAKLQWKWCVVYGTAEGRTPS